MASRFQRATRERSKLRMALDGPSGSGKTATALRFATVLAHIAAAEAGRPNDPRIAVIDSEHGSARKYVGEDFGEGPIAFDVVELSSYAPTEYTSAIEEAGRAGYDVIVPDSLSHAWEGKDGALEQVDKTSGNKFAAWKDVTPQHRRMIEAIITSPAHVICTMRSKTDYVLEEDEKGRKVPVRVGTAPVQRAGMEYEFDVYGSLDWAHTMRVSKSRCRAVDGWIGVKPGEAFIRPVIDWLNTGAAASPSAGIIRAGIGDDQLARIIAVVDELGWTMDGAAKNLPALYGVAELSLLGRADADGFADWLEKELRKKKLRDAATAKRQEAVAPAAPASTLPPSSSPPAPTAAPAAPARGTITDEQLKRIADLRSDLFADVSRETMMAAWHDILSKRGVTSAVQMTQEAAELLIGAIAHKLDCRMIDRSINGPQATGATPNGSPGVLGGAAPPAATAEQFPRLATGQGVDGAKGGAPAASTAGPQGGARDDADPRAASANPHRH